MRATWSGDLSFGLVNIPVKLISAIEASNELDLDMLSGKDLAPIRYARIDSQTGEEVPWKEIVKGYQYAKGKYVVVTDEDFEKASPGKSKSIDILQFVKEDEIDPIYYEKPYYLTPAKKDAAKTYKVLLRALEETGTIGIAEFVMRNRMHICALRAHNGTLLLNQLRYHQEIKDMPEQKDVDKEKVTEAELDLAVQLVHQLTEPYKPETFKDTYINELKKIIKAKAAGKSIRIAEPKKQTATVKDLMEVLKQSLEKQKKSA
jgi:DNA end-binding protein Ku